MITWLLVVLGILWFVDEILTIIDLRKFGLGREENPIARYFVKHGKYAFTVFKIFSFAVFVWLIKYIESIDATVAQMFLIGIIVLYAIVDIRNYEIMVGKL